MQEQLFNLAFWYWLYDRIAELGHDGSIELLALREEFFAQFGVLYSGSCETFDNLLETQKKRKRIYEQRGRVRILGWNQHKLKGLRPIEQRINDRNRQRKRRDRDTSVTEAGHERDPRARAHTQDSILQTPTPDTDTDNTAGSSPSAPAASSKFEFPEPVAKELKEHWQFYETTLNFNAPAWATRALKAKAPPNEVAHVLRRMATASVADKIDKPWPWANKTLAELTKNAAFETVVAEHDNLKRKDFVTAGDVLAGIKAKG